MVAPMITFWTSSATFTGTAPPANCFALDVNLGQLATVFDYGTIDTGSSGSNYWIWIFNNATGSVQSIADAILSSSGQTYADGISLGLGHHESGSASHWTESSYGWSLQSGSLTGSVWAISNFYYKGLTGSVAAGASGAMASAWVPIYSGSSGSRLSTSGLVLSGSTSLLGASGSGWLVGTYIYVQNGISQGSKTGSFCLKYKYT